MPGAGEKNVGAQNTQTVVQCACHQQIELFFIGALVAQQAVGADVLPTVTGINDDVEPFKRLLGLFSIRRKRGAEIDHDIFSVEGDLIAIERHPLF